MTYDLVVVGAGAAGEAAGSAARELGARVATVERDLVGGECAFWACMPSKTLLDAARWRAMGADYPWERASERRDWMISREGIPYPDDGGHARGAEEGEGELVRGEARIVGPGRVEVRLVDGGSPRKLEARALVIATGSVPLIPPIDGLREAGFWTNREATSLRELPSSIVVLGGGPVGVEMAQVYVRFGVRTVLVEGHDRILPRDHPRSSAAVAAQLRDEGLDIRTGVRATGVAKGGAGRTVRLSDGATLEASVVLVAVGRRPADLRAIGIEEAGVRLDERGASSPDESLRIGEGVFVAGDAAGGLQFTHVADYEGRIAARAALGTPSRADLSAVPRTTFTDPETGAVGLTVEEASSKGIDAFEVTADFATSARGFTLERVGGGPKEGAPGHITAVVDRDRGILCGAFAACPGASELISEAVLAIKQGIPVSVLADTIRAFPTGARVFGNVMGDAARRLQ
ncbi:MAG: NAD(P)/FAD-dependent oxidoreductase [Actinobacteria bacterium]|nr:NAD(P)/FAD-dependent oxidoreductase [Actinomycetota bacterium]